MIARCFLLAVCATVGLIVPGAAESSNWNAKTFKAPGTVVDLFRLASGVLVDVSGADLPARYYRVRLKQGQPDLEAMPNFLIAPSERRPDMLPDGVISRYGRGVSEAWLSGPTRRYSHGVIGDAIEASGLQAVDENGVFLRLDLPDDSVFEDRYPRFADLDGDQEDEIILVRSYLDAGAALAIIKATDGSLKIIAETTPIGRPNRWLNPAGVADFDGDGRLEVAIVVTPHIGGTMKLFELTTEGLQLEFERSGFSNHYIGSRELGMSAILDADDDDIADLAVPADGRRMLRIVSFKEGEIHDLVAVDHQARISTGIYAIDLDGNGTAELVYGLEDGSLIVLSR